MANRPLDSGADKASPGKRVMSQSEAGQRSHIGKVPKPLSKKGHAALPKKSPPKPGCNAWWAQ